MPKRRVRSRIQKEASPRHCCAERSNPGARSSIWIATAGSVPRDDGVPGRRAVRATARRLKGETLEILPGKPQSDTVAPALETEEAPGTPEPLVQIARRLLHVLTGILILLLVYTFYVSSPVLIPVTLAVLITMLLSPAVSLLEGLKMPRPLSAAVAIAMLVGVLGGGVYGLSGPAQQWLKKLPQSGGKIDEMLRSIKKPFAQIEQATEHLAAATDRRNATAPQMVQLEPASLTDRVAGGTAQLAAALSVIFVLVFFLLSSGDTFLRKLVSVIPTFADKKRTVETIRSIESDISFYLVMMLLINMGLGLGVVLITAILGIPDPLLWGALTVILSFAPYVGEMAITVTLLNHIDGYLRYARQGSYRTRRVHYFDELCSHHGAGYRQAAALAQPSGGFYRHHLLRLDLGHAWRTACGPAFGKLQNHLRAHRAS